MSRNRHTTATLLLGLLLVISSLGTASAQLPADKLPKGKKLMGEWELQYARAIDAKGQDLQGPEIVKELAAMNQDFKEDKISIVFLDNATCNLMEHGQPDKATYKVVGKKMIITLDGEKPMDVSYDKQRKSLVLVIEKDEGENQMFLLAYFIKVK